MLIEKGADPRQTDNAGLSPLTFACISNQDTGVIKTLLNVGAQVNHTDSFDNSPLIYASYHGNSETIKCLLDHGANPNHRSHFRLSTLNVSGQHLVSALRLPTCCNDTPAKLVRRTRPIKLPRWLEERLYSPAQIHARNEQRKNARQCLDILQGRRPGSPEAIPPMAPSGMDHEAAT